MTEERPQQPERREARCGQQHERQAGGQCPVVECDSGQHPGNRVGPRYQVAGLHRHQVFPGETVVEPQIQKVKVVLPEKEMAQEERLPDDLGHNEGDAAEHRQVASCPVGEPRPANDGCLPIAAHGDGPRALVSPHQRAARVFARASPERSRRVGLRHAVKPGRPSGRYGTGRRTAPEDSSYRDSPCHPGTEERACGNP